MKLGRNQYNGFSLIELIIVMVLIAIIAVIAIPNLVKVTTNATRSAMISDLKNLVIVQANQYSIDEVYVDNDNFQETLIDTQKYYVTGENQITIDFADENGWEATITNPQTNGTCSVYVGSRVTGTDSEGVPSCTGF